MMRIQRIVNTWNIGSTRFDVFKIEKDESSSNSTSEKYLQTEVDYVLQYNNSVKQNWMQFFEITGNQIDFITGLEPNLYLSLSRYMRDEDFRKKMLLNMNYMVKEENLLKSIKLSQLRILESMLQPLIDDHI